MTHVIEGQTKLVGETVTLEFDFTSRMTGDDYAVTATCGAEVLVGEDPDVEDFIHGDCAVEDGSNRVTQQIIAGVAGVIYLVTCACRTAENNVYMMQMKVAVFAGEDLDPDIL